MRSAFGQVLSALRGGRSAGAFRTWLIPSGKSVIAWTKAVVAQATQKDRRFTKVGEFLRGETSSAEAMQRRVQYDLEYLKNWSLALDLKIIAKTALLLLHGSKRVLTP